MRLFFSLFLLSVLPCFSGSAAVSFKTLGLRLGLTNITATADCASFNDEEGDGGMRLYSGRRRAMVDGVACWLNAMPGSDWQLVEADADAMGVWTLPNTNRQERLRIVIDAGHGGADDGAIGLKPATFEKEMTLDLALQTRDLLAADAFDVVLTRTNDVTLSLSERTLFQTNADLFVSIHGNFAVNKGASGIETYVFASPGYPGTSEGSPVRAKASGHAFDLQSAAAGFALHRRLIEEACLKSNTNSIDRGLKRANFYVLRESKCPAVLIEAGFLSNSSDGILLTNSIYRATLARAIANGIKDYAAVRADVEIFAAAVKERKAAAIAKKIKPVVPVEQPPATNAPEVTVSDPVSTNLPPAEAVSEPAATNAIPVQPEPVPVKPEGGPDVPVH